MKLVLHIGTEKTGTTAAQDWFHRNTDALKAQGVWYAQALGLPDHRALSVMARPGTDREDGFARFGISNPAEHAGFVSSRLALLGQDVAAAKRAGAEHYLISSEHLQSRLPTPAMVARVAEILRAHFKDIEVICFLRPQVDAAVSLACTASRVGNYVDRQFFRTLRPSTTFYDYASLLERWATAFGTASVSVVPFKQNPSPVAYFKSRLGLGEAYAYAPERRTNSLLDYRVVALTNMWIGGAQAAYSPPPHPMSQRYFVNYLRCEEPLSLSLRDAQNFHADFAPMNRAIAAAWPSITEEDLTPDWSRYPQVGTVEMLDKADVSDVLQEVFCRFNADLAMQRSRILLYESREAEADGNVEVAIDRMDEALAALRNAMTVDHTREWATTQHQHYAERREKLRTKIEARAARGA